MSTLFYRKICQLHWMQALFNASRTLTFVLLPHHNPYFFDAVMNMEQLKKTKIENLPRDSNSFCYSNNYDYGYYLRNIYRHCQNRVAVDKWNALKPQHTSIYQCWPNRNFIFILRVSIFMNWVVVFKLFSAFSRAILVLHFHFFDDCNENVVNLENGRVLRIWTCKVNVLLNSFKGK